MSGVNAQYLIARKVLQLIAQCAEASRLMCRPSSDEVAAEVQQLREGDCRSDQYCCLAYLRPRIKISPKSPISYLSKSLLISSMVQDMEEHE